jgi:hypothetical protein
MSSYPGSLDAFTNPAGSDPLSGGHAAQHGAVNDAVEAIEAELGVTPSAGYSTVAARLTAIEAAIGGGGGGSFAPVLHDTFTTASSVSVDDCFVGDGYYRVLLEITAWSAASNGCLRFRDSGTDDSTSNIYQHGSFYHSTTTPTNYGTASGNDRIENIWYGANDSNMPLIVEFTVNGANLSRWTHVRGQHNYRNSGDLTEFYFHAVHMSASSFDGFTFYPGSGTITGEVTVWEYPKA